MIATKLFCGVLALANVAVVLIWLIQLEDVAMAQCELQHSTATCFTELKP